MKIKEVSLAIFFLGISSGLFAQLKIKDPQRLTLTPKKLVFYLVKMDFSKFDFARLSSKNKIDNYSVISTKEKSALAPANATESEVAESVTTITVEDGKLVSHLQPECAELYNVQQDDYFYLKAEGADIEFTKDETGSINLVIRRKAVMQVKK